jgi:hypothetical protein
VDRVGQKWTTQNKKPRTRPGLKVRRIDTMTPGGATTNNIPHSGDFRQSRNIPPVSTPAVAVGSLALGALAVGALAIGALAVGRLDIRQARLRKVEIDDLTVRRLRVPLGKSTERWSTKTDPSK